MERGDRDRVVQEFRNGITKILISTDVLSRGFDVSQVRWKHSHEHMAGGECSCLAMLLLVARTCHCIARYPPTFFPTLVPGASLFVLQVTLVVNFNVPMERDGRSPAYETYLHRIGRSGRFGRKGAAFNLICGPEVGEAQLQQMARRLL